MAKVVAAFASVANVANELLFNWIASFKWATGWTKKKHTASQLRSLFYDDE